MITPYPYIPGHVRRYLLDQPEVAEKLGDGRIVAGGSIPDPLTGLHVRVGVTGQSGSTPRARRILVQVTPWFPEDPSVTGTYEDPAMVVWEMATVMGQAAARAKNEVIDEHTAWRAEWIEGPIELFDVKRGPDRPLLYTPITLKVTVSHR